MPFYESKYVVALYLSDVMGSVLYFLTLCGAVGAVVLWLVGRVGRTRWSRLAVGALTLPVLGEVVPSSPLPGRQQQQQQP